MTKTNSTSNLNANGNKWRKSFAEAGQKNQILQKIQMLKAVDSQLRKLSKPKPSLKFDYLVDFHTPTNPLEYERINSNQVGQEL